MTRGTFGTTHSLQIKPVFIVQVLTTFPDLGFAVSGDTGVLTPESVALVSDTSVLLTFGSPLSGTSVVSYTDVSHSGSGNICDRDPAVSLDNWIFTAGSGQRLTENFSGPITNARIVSNRQPYPLWNYACPSNQITAVANSYQLAMSLSHEAKRRVGWTEPVPPNLPSFIGARFNK